MIADVDALLGPVDASAPAGADLRYLPIYDEIKTARRDAEADPTELAPWRKVAELVVKAIGRSKDLQLAVWLIEALARIDGFQGASGGLIVLRRMIEQYWDSVYPQIDPEDNEPLGFRRALLDWVDDRLPAIVKTAPLTGPPSFYGLLHYEVTQKTGDEKKALMDEGWPTHERFAEALNSTSAERLEAMLGQVMACDTELVALQATVDQRFNATPGGGEPLSFVTLKETFETARWLLQRALKKGLPADGTQAAADAQGPGGAVVSSVNGDQLWTEALTLTRDSRVDGLRLLQTQLAVATSGRDTFLRQLQLAELSLEAGVYSLAYPVFDELARTIDSRRLDEWEDKALLARVFKGLARCCGLLKQQNPAAAAREAESLDRAARLDAPA